MFADINIWSALSPDEQFEILRRPALVDDLATREQAARIIAAVRRDGDAALFEFAKRFEGRRPKSTCQFAPGYAASGATRRSTLLVCMYLPDLRPCPRPQ